MKKIKIIAEIGVNHNSKRKIGKKLILEAKKAGADSVKFQTFKAKTLTLKNTPKVPYQINNTNETHFEMLEKLELSEKDHLFYLNVCKRNNIEFISTPNTVDDAKLLCDLKIRTIKTSSADLIDHKLHEYLSTKKKNVIISTGMATLSEVDETLKIYKKNNNSSISLLHCVSNYPCSDRSLNMNNIITLKKKYNFPIGFSDHSLGSTAAVIALSLGANIFEKHFTLNKNYSGPDHKASITPSELKKYVDILNKSKMMMGSFEKQVQKEELQMKKISRKSLVYSSNFSKGTRIVPSLLECKRPGTGILPSKIKNIEGKKLARNVKKDQQVDKKDFF